MKKTVKNFATVLLGIAVLGTGAGIAANADIKADAKQTTMVGKLDTDQWVVINPAEENETWRCADGNDVCSGTLKPNATPNPDGSYNDSEVNFSPSPQNQQFELIP